MASQTLLRELKSIFRDQLGLPPWVVLVAVGCLAHVVLNAVFRRPITSPWGLLAPVCLGVALESYEIWIQYRNVGLFAPSNDTLLTILARHGLDIVFMIAGPILLVVVGVIFAKLN